MIIALILITVFFLVSLYLIFIKPQETVQWAGPSEGPSTSSSSDGRINHRLQSELSHKTNQIKKLELEIKEERTSLSEGFDNKLDEKDSQLSQKQAALDELRTKSAANIEELTKQIASLKAQTDQVNAKLSEKETASKKIESDLSELQVKSASEKEKLVEQINSLKSEIEELKPKLDEKGNEISQKELALNEFRVKTAAEKEDLIKRISSLHSKLDVLDSKVAETEEIAKQVNPLKAEINELNSKLNEKDSQITQKEVMLNDFKTKAHKEKEDLVKQISSLQSKTAELNASVAKRELETSQHTGKIDELHRKLGTKSGELQSYLQSYKNEIENYKKMAAAHEKKAAQLNEDNHRLRKMLTESSKGKGKVIHDKDTVVSDLNNKLNMLKDKYITKMSQAKGEIDNLTREIRLKEKAIEGLKTGQEKEKNILKEKTSAKVTSAEEYKKLKTDYDDLKGKSDWLVKLLREETDKTSKLQKEIEELKKKKVPSKTEKSKEEKEDDVLISKSSGDNKKMAYFLKIYQDNLKNVFFNEDKLSADIKDLKLQYLNLMRQSQMVASLLREEMNKNYALQDENSRLKNQSEKKEKADGD